MFHVRMKGLLSKMEDIELHHLKKDLLEEDSVMRQLIEQELSRRALEHKHICTACGSDLQGTNQFTLLFGPEGFKKRASFCGLDCMEQFTAKLREHKYKAAQPPTQQPTQKMA